MGNRKLIRGEKHHWWPQSLSRYWASEEGFVHRIDTQGVDLKLRPRKLGCISDGHNFFAKKGESTPWDQTFEDSFDRPDRNFPMMVEWLNGRVQRHETERAKKNLDDYYPHSCSTEYLQQLCECLVSLAVRSPKFRADIVGSVESLRGKLSISEPKRLATANMMLAYQRIVDALTGKGKFVVFFTDSREFIFGDGFYHSLVSTTQHAVLARILAPLTPNLAVLYTCPMAMYPNPPLFTRKANDNLVEQINLTVQIYSKNWLFFRTEKPKLSKHFISQEHLVIDSGDPVDELIANIPGVNPGGLGLPY